MTTDSISDTKLTEPWLSLARVIWFVLMLWAIAFFIAGVSPEFNELRLACAGEDCFEVAISPQEAALLRDVGLSMEFYAGYEVGLEIFLVVLFTPLAVLIFWRRSDSWIGILVSLTLVFSVTVFTTSAPGALVRLYPSLQLTFDLLQTISDVLFVLLFYLFPDGRFVPRWTGVVAVVFAGVVLIEPLLPVRSTPTASGADVVVVLIVLLGLIVGVLAQIYRYRRVSTPTQRQQTKWVMFGLLVTATVIFMEALFIVLFPLQPGPARLAFNFSQGVLTVLFALFPLSVVFSILRYRLWDIDLVINRALLYGLLTGTLILVYFGSVILMQSVFTALDGQQSVVAIVISTLIIAALFAPLRRRIQDLIDRRFFRRKYNAERVLAQFAQTARDETDLDRLTSELVRVVQETMQPAHVSVWLKKTPK